jgi:hypothetical protein
VAPILLRRVRFICPALKVRQSSDAPVLPGRASDDLLGDLQAEKQALKLPIDHRFYSHLEMTVDNFLREVGSTRGAVAFIGHSVLLPDVGSVGHEFADMSLTLPGYVGLRGEMFNREVSRLRTTARVVFVAACDVKQLYLDLWNFDATSQGQALIVPTTSDTNLYAASLAWRAIARDLAQGRTVSEAVAAVNGYMNSIPDNPLRFELALGLGGDVTLR